MQKFTTHTGLTVPLDNANVDTDQIIPKQFLQKVERVGFGQHLFHDSRYLDDEGKIDNPDFVLNKPQYKDSSILLARENFGCGSSREHAPWSLQEYGFKVIIAPSFADIFYANCINIGMLPVRLTEQQVDVLFQLAKNQQLQITVNLKEQLIQFDNQSFSFDINEFQKYCLINGIDSIGWSLQKLDKIEAYEKEIPGWRR